MSTDSHNCALGKKYRECVMCTGLYAIDLILANSCLKDLFSNIYGLDPQPEETVEGAWSTHGWNFRFRGKLNDWEVDTVVELFRTLEEFNGTKEGPDRLRWKWTVESASELVQLISFSIETFNR